MLRIRTSSAASRTARCGVREPDYRRKGCATTVTTALLDWFRNLGCTLYEVYAVGEADGLYRGLGFETDPGCMRMTSALRPP
ncbi:GNAT family N-acetyltransferase [Streptomyces violascens]|uniref:GNAT family N-acetyltransferase n=1 Tax=Streptomyces violascens TaxID=67381 RepID=UPI003668912C